MDNCEKSYKRISRLLMKQTKQIQAVWEVITS